MSALCLSAYAVTPEEFVGQAPAQKTADNASVDNAKSGKTPSPNAPAPRTASKKSGKPGPALDTAGIHATYLDGDFEKATRLLEKALQQGSITTHADSVFTFKHLGVMYAANAASRDRGRFYMLQLISIEPTAKILDMYASDLIYLIFRNVQEEYEKKGAKWTHAGSGERTPAPGADSAALAADASTAKGSAVQSDRPAADPAPASAAASKEVRDNRRTLYWVAGGAAVAAGAAGLLFILLDGPEPRKRTIVLNE